MIALEEGYAAIEAIDEEPFAVVTEGRNDHQRNVAFVNDRIGAHTGAKGDAQVPTAHRYAVIRGPLATLFVGCQGGLDTNERHESRENGSAPPVVHYRIVRPNGVSYQDCSRCSQKRMLCSQFRV